MEELESQANQHAENAEQEEEQSIIDKLRELFGEQIANAFKVEEIDSPEAIQDLLQKDSDSNIFVKLGLSYGKAVKFKTNFIHYMKDGQKSSSSSIKKEFCKPTMARLSLHNADTKRLYLAKRKKVGVLATKKWGTQLPKFNTPEKRNELETFAKEISAEVEVPEVGFGLDGIMKHTKDFFNEQRRQKKGKKYSSSDDSDAYACSQIAETIQERDDKPNRKKLKQSTSTSDCESSSSTDDTVILSEDGEELKTPEGLSTRAIKLIIKLVCGSLIQERDTLVNVLTSEFSVSKRNLTQLTHSNLSEILVKKMIKQGYVQLKKGVDFGNLLKSDVTVKKGILL